MENTQEPTLEGYMDKLGLKLYEKKYLVYLFSNLLNLKREEFCEMLEPMKIFEPPIDDPDQPLNVHADAMNLSKQKRLVIIYALSGMLNISNDDLLKTAMEVRDGTKNE